MKTVILFILLSINCSADVFLNYTGNNDYYKKVINKANAILNSGEFYTRIANRNQFDSTKLSPIEIANLMKDCNNTIQVDTYWYINPFKPRNCVYANTKSNRLISINRRCFSDNIDEAVNTLIHEVVHTIDYNNGTLEFTHSYKPTGQENTAPWAIGQIAQDLVDKQ
jgi:hypothetical protein